MSSNRGYTVVPANELYRGKSYAEWISDWYNWFVSEEPDDHNRGPVVFLKSYPSPRKLKAKAEDKEPMDSSYKSTFINYPNLAVGNDSIEIFDDQAILAPVMGANMDAEDSATTEEYMRNWVRNQIDNGDNPPKSYQLTINGQPVFDDEDALHAYRVETPLFQLMIPDTEFGASLKDFMEIPYKPGIYNSVADGYFVLLKDLKKTAYVIHCYSQGSNYGGKQRYYSEYIYHIKILNREGRTSSPSMGFIPDRFTNLLKEELKEKLHNNEIEKSEYDSLKKLIDSTRDRQQSIVGIQERFRKLVTKIGPDEVSDKLQKIIDETPKNHEL